MLQNQEKKDQEEGVPEEKKDQEEGIVVNF